MFKIPDAEIGAAFGAAVGHLIFFHFLDGREVSTSISQSWVSVVSFGLVQIFALSLGTSVTTGMAQLLWWYLRRKSFKLKTVDNMFSMHSRTISILDYAAWKGAPVLAVCALFVLCLPIVSVFPPGAMMVVFAEVPVVEAHSVPIFDPKWRAQNNSNWLADHTTIWYGPESQTNGLTLGSGSWLVIENSRIGSANESSGAHKMAPFCFIRTPSSLRLSYSHHLSVVRTALTRLS